MDYLVISLDVSSLAVGLFALGFVIGMAVGKPVFTPLAVISILFGANASRYIFGAHYDSTVTASYFITFFTVGMAIGNYIEYRNRETKTMLNMMQVQLNTLTNYLVKRECDNKESSN